MTGDDKELLERHLKELKAKSKSKSFSSFVGRVRAEQEFRRALGALGESYHSQEIMPFLAARREQAGLTPDFVAWKDEFKIPIFLVETADSEIHSISRDKAKGFLDYLRRTDYTEFLIVWTDPPQFPSSLVRIEDMEEKLRGHEDSFEFVDARPFREVFMEVMGQKATVWPVPKLEMMPEVIQIETFLKTLESTFRAAFQEEATKRRPHLLYKKEALDTIAGQDVDKICRTVVGYVKGELSLEDFGRFFRSVTTIGTKSPESGQS